jgi:hypothetical protein
VTVSQAASPLSSTPIFADVEHRPAPAEMEVLDRIEARLEDTSPRYRRAASRIEEGRRRHREMRHDAHRRDLRLLLP